MKWEQEASSCCSFQLARILGFWAWCHQFRCYTKNCTYTAPERRGSFIYHTYSGCLRHVSQNLSRWDSEQQSASCGYQQKFLLIRKACSSGWVMSLPYSEPQTLLMGACTQYSTYCGLRRSKCPLPIWRIINIFKGKFARNLTSLTVISSLGGKMCNSKHILPIFAIWPAIINSQNCRVNILKTSISEEHLHPQAVQQG